MVHEAVGCYRHAKRIALQREQYMKNFATAFLNEWDTTDSIDLFGNFSFRTGYLEMRCSKSCYLRDLELVDLFDNGVIEQV